MTTKISFFSWNLKHKDSSLKAAITHLSKQGTFIAALQEVPKLTDPRTFVNFTVQAYNKSIYLLSSSDIPELKTSAQIVISNTKILYNPERAIGRKLNIKGIGDVLAFSVHFPDNMQLQRGSDKHKLILSEIISALNAHLIQQTVVMGDFNADPFHPEIASCGLIGGWRDLAEFHHRQRKQMKHNPKFFNPIWKYVSDRPGHPKGTHYFMDDFVSVGWHCYDQILISKPFAEKPVEFDILDKLNGVSLTRDSKGVCGKIIDPSWGDHLPVQAKISF